MAIGGAQFAHRRGSIAIAGFRQFPGGPVIASAGIDRDVWLHADRFAQDHEFIRADVVGLERVPDGIKSSGKWHLLASAATVLKESPECFHGENV
jgi:hypothetical protein